MTKREASHLKVGDCIVELSGANSDSYLSGYIYKVCKGENLLWIHTELDSEGSTSNSGHRETFRKATDLEREYYNKFNKPVRIEKDTLTFIILQMRKEIGL